MSKGILSVRGALLWSFGERYASLVVTLASTMILARLLTPAQVGIFSLCASVSAVAGILRDFGVSEYLIQEKDLTRDKLRAAFALAIITAWSIAIVILLFRSTIAGYYAEPGLAAVLAVLSLNFLILPFASPAFALLNREMAFRKIFVVQTTGNIVQAATAIALAMQGHSYMSLAWASVTSSAIQTVMITFLRPRDSLLMPSLREARAVLAYGSMFVSSRVIETFTRNSHEFIIAKQFGFAAVGIFSRALGLIELFYTNVSSAILRVATPAFAADHRAGARLAPAFARGTAIFTSIAWPFFGFLALMSGDIIHVLFGPQWDAAAPIAKMLAIVTLPTYLFALGPNLLAATGHVKRRLKISLWYSPVHLVGVLVASTISLEAVAAVWGLSGLMMLAMYVYHLRQVLKATANELFRPCLLSAWVAGCSVAAQALAWVICHQYNLPALVPILVVAFIGVLAWLMVARASRHPAFDEVLRFATHFRISRSRQPPENRS